MNTRTKSPWSDTLHFYCRHALRFSASIHGVRNVLRSGQPGFRPRLPHVLLQAGGRQVRSDRKALGGNKHVARRETAIARNGIAALAAVDAHERAFACLAGGGGENWESMRRSVAPSKQAFPSPLSSSIHARTSFFTPTVTRKGSVCRISTTPLAISARSELFSSWFSRQLSIVPGGAWRALKSPRAWSRREAR